MLSNKKVKQLKAGKLPFKVGQIFNTEWDGHSLVIVTGTACGVLVNRINGNVVQTDDLNTLLLPSADLRTLLLLQKYTYVANTGAGDVTMPNCTSKKQAYKKVLKFLLKNGCKSSAILSITKRK